MSGQAAATAASDWRVEHSQKLNKPYYYNVRTKESRWSLPPGMSSPPRVGAATATSQPQNLVVSATTSQNAPNASVHAVPHNATVTPVAAAAAAGTASRDAASHEITDRGGVVSHAAHAQQTGAVGNTRPTSTASHDDSGARHDGSRPSSEHPPKARASLKPIVIRAAQFVSAEDDDTSSVVGGAAAAEVGEAGRKTYIANIG
jgi:hypothetical protein